MNSQLLLLFLGVALAITFFIKTSIHAHLDSKNNYSSKPRTAMFLHPAYLLSYRNKVGKEYEKIKRLCNILWRISVILFAALLFIKFF